MNTLTSHIGRMAAAITLVTAAILNPVHAAPGAHGPNGEHLDSKETAQTGRQQVPTFEAKSELFEMVGRFNGGELSLLIDRYETNEPVLEAAVDVESGAVKAAAKFHADLGDYAIDDQAFLKALGAPGEHPLIITVVAGQDSDLLDGVLHVGGQDLAHDDNGHDHGPMPWGRWALIALAFLGFALLARGLNSSHAAKKTNELKGDAA